MRNLLQCFLILSLLMAFSCEDLEKLAQGDQEILNNPDNGEKKCEGSEAKKPEELEAEGEGSEEPETKDKECGEEKKGDQIEIENDKEKEKKPVRGEKEEENEPSNVDPESPILGNWYIVPSDGTFSNYFRLSSDEAGSWIWELRYQDALSPPGTFNDAGAYIVTEGAIGNASVNFNMKIREIDDQKKEIIVKSEGENTINFSSGDDSQATLSDGEYAKFVWAFDGDNKVVICFIDSQVRISLEEVRALTLEGDCNKDQNKWFELAKIVIDKEEEEENQPDPEEENEPLNVDPESPILGNWYRMPSEGSGNQGYFRIKQSEDAGIVATWEIWLKQGGSGFNDNGTYSVTSSGSLSTKLVGLKDESLPNIDIVEINNDDKYIVIQNPSETSEVSINFSPGKQGSAWFSYDQQVLKLEAGHYAKLVWNDSPDFSAWNNNHLPPEPEFSPDNKLILCLVISGTDKDTVQAENLADGCTIGHTNAAAADNKSGRLFILAKVNNFEVIENED